MANLSNNEIELLKASIQGNTAAFESIVKKYQSYVCAITYSAIPDMEKSEDMAQETFLHVWNNLSKLKDLTKFKSWMISITRNIISDFIKKQKRDLINNAAPIEQIENTQTKQVEPVDNVMTKEQQAVVQNALMQIPEKYREPLVLFYRHEQSVKHIAGQLDLSEELVKQHLSRGRKLLKEQVASMVEGAIRKTGPTKAFTSIVMASIAGLAVKGTVATAAVAGTSAIMSSLSAKIITAVAVIAIGIGSVVTFNHFTKSEQDNQSITPANPINETNQITNPEITLPASNINIAANNIQQSTQPETDFSLYANNTVSENVTNNLNLTSNNISEITDTISLSNKPIDSPYEYFLFTRYNQGSSTRTLVLAHIINNGIQLTDISTEDFGKYHWGDPICVIGGQLYSSNYNNLYCINLLTREFEEFSIRPDRPPFSIFNFSFDNIETCFADSSFYGITLQGNISILRQLDFKKRAYRDIAEVNLTQSNIIAISPDNKRLAYFDIQKDDAAYPSTNREGYFLTIVDTETGKITQPSKPINFQVALIASSFPGIPIIWINSETVVFIRTNIPESDKELDLDSDGEHILSIASVDTGEIEDILPLPGNPFMRFAPSLIQDYKGIGPRVHFGHEKYGDYRLDLKNRKLVEDDLISGDYRISFGHLYYKGKNLGYAERKDIHVSDDSKRVIWMSARKLTDSSNAEDNETAHRNAIQSNDTTLYYYDESLNEPVSIARVYNSTGFWLKAEDLKMQSSKINLSSKWTLLKNISENNPTQQWVDTRKRTKDYLTCVIETDKETYFLHEPVEVTLTLINKSNADITIIKPNILSSIMRPTTGTVLNYPGGSKTIDYGAEPYSPSDEELVLKAGESFTTTDKIDVSLTGDYALEYTYELSPLQQEYIGSIISEKINFAVEANNDKQEEQKLFDAKFTRLINKFHQQIEMDPNWNGYNSIVGDNIIGLPGMGKEAATYIIKEIENDSNKNSRNLLFRALSDVAGPEYLPFFKERLINNHDNPEQICSWLLDTYCGSDSDESVRKQVIDALILGMKIENVNDRREICDTLTEIYNESIETCFANAIEDKDEKLRLDAGFYLAAAKWLDLAEWLKSAESKFDYINYISALAVIDKLEKQYNISKGELPVLTKEDFTIAKEIEDAEQQYKKVLGDWLSWSEENPRASFTFFEDYRERWWENDPFRQE